VPEPIANILPEFINDRSAYYQNQWFARIAVGPELRIPIFNAGRSPTPVHPVENLRMANRLLSIVPGYPIQQYYGDYQHFVQNKAKEWGDLCGLDHHVCTSSDYRPATSRRAARPTARRTTASMTCRHFASRRQGRAAAGLLDDGAPDRPQNASAGSRKRAGATFTGGSSAGAAACGSTSRHAGGDPATEPNTACLPSTRRGRVQRRERCRPLSGLAAISDSPVLGARDDDRRHEVTVDYGLDRPGSAAERACEPVPGPFAGDFGRGPTGRERARQRRFELRNAATEAYRVDRAGGTTQRMTSVPSSITVDGIHLRLPVREPHAGAQGLQERGRDSALRTAHSWAGRSSRVPLQTWQRERLGQVLALADAFNHVGSQFTGRGRDVTVGLRSSDQAGGDSQVFDVWPRGDRWTRPAP
jgi:hypothetical protein